MSPSSQKPMTEVIAQVVLTNIDSTDFEFILTEPSIGHRFSGETESRHEWIRNMVGDYQCHFLSRSE
jgi:hypothetical protein